MKSEIIRSKLKIILILIITLNFVACSFTNNKVEESVPEQEITQEDNIQEEYIVPDSKEIVEKMCCDEFEGRLVGSEGNKKAEEYLADIMKNLNLEPLFIDEYYESYEEEVPKPYDFMDDNNEVDTKMEVHNLAGIIKGEDNSKAIVISAHFDHIGYQDGAIIREALDNASGVATVIKIADNLKKQSEEKLFSRDIIIALFNSEEIGLRGSKAFVNDIKGKYDNLYNINIDCVGGKSAGKISLNNKSKISDKLTNEMKQVFKDNNMEYSNTELIRGTSDHKSFEKGGFCNIYIGQDNLKPYIHNTTDTPETLDYEEIDNIAHIICDFIEKNQQNDY